MGHYVVGNKVVYFGNSEGSNHYIDRIRTASTKEGTIIDINIWQIENGTEIFDDFRIKWLKDYKKNRTIFEQKSIINKFCTKDPYTNNRAELQILIKEKGNKGIDKIVIDCLDSLLLLSEELGIDTESIERYNFSGIVKYAVNTYRKKAESDKVMAISLIKKSAPLQASATKQRN